MSYSPTPARWFTPFVILITIAAPLLLFMTPAMGQVTFEPPSITGSPLQWYKNVHTHSNGVYLGYGDGKDSDGYGHPFVDYPNNEWKIADFYVDKSIQAQGYGRYPIADCYADHEHYADGYGPHIHLSDTHSAAKHWEDLWYSRVGSASPAVSRHMHRHEGYLGCKFP